MPLYEAVPKPGQCACRRNHEKLTIILARLIFILFATSALGQTPTEQARTF
jgi:hypothetical protein